MKKIKLHKGFTLIELLIVITIIGILAVALLPSVLGAPARARDAARRADLANIVAALELYGSDNGGYPPAGCIDDGFANGDLKKYISGGVVPKDPQTKSTAQLDSNQACSGQYAYCPVSGVVGVSYMVAAAMEIPADGNVSAQKTSCSGPTTLVSGNTLSLNDNPEYVILR